MTRAKTYVYSIDDGSEDKTAKGTKKCVILRKHKFENYKNCWEATKLENKIKFLETNKVNIDSVKKDNQEFMTKQWINITKTAKTLKI